MEPEPVKLPVARGVPAGFNDEFFKLRGKQEGLSLGLQGKELQWHWTN